MKKKKLLKILIPSIIAVVVVVGGIIAAILLTRPKKFGDSELFAEVGSRLYENNAALASAYNSQEGVFESSAPVFGSGNSNGIEVYEGEDSFNEYISNANLVMGYYAISEYLNEQDGIKLEKTYNYNSSTVQYFAVASSSKNKFSLKLLGGFELIEVVVNYEKSKKKIKPLNIEFYQRQGQAGNYRFLTAIIDFEKSTYNQVAFETNLSELPDEISAEDSKNRFNNFNYFHLDYKDFSKYEGFVAKNIGLNPSGLDGNKVSKYYKKYKKNLSFKNFDNNFNMKKYIDFPNPEDLETYSFNKYEVSLEENEKGEKKLITSRRNGMNSDVFDAINTYKKLSFSEKFDTLNYTVEGDEIKFDHKTLYPSIDSIYTNIKNWIKNEYDKEAYYYKTIDNDEFQILIYANRFMYSEMYENEVKIVSINSYEKGSWNFKYYHSNNTSSFLYSIKKKTYSYDANGEKFDVNEFYFEKSEYDLKYSDLDDDGTYYTTKTLDSVLYHQVTNKNKDIVNLQYVYETKDASDEKVTKYEINKYNDDAQVGIKTEHAVNETYIDSINDEIKRITENVANENQERSDVSFDSGGICVKFWRNKVAWQAANSFDEIETLNFKMIVDGKVIVNKKPLRSQYKHTFKGGIVEFHFDFMHKGIKKYSYIKFKIDGKYDWDKISIVDAKFNYTLTNGMIRARVSETGVTWEFLNGATVIEQRYNKGSDVQILENTKRSLTINELFSSDYSSSSGSLYVKYMGEFGEESALISLNANTVTYLKPSPREVFTGISASLSDSFGDSGVSYTYTKLNGQTITSNYAADFFLKRNKIAFIFKDQKREIYYREDVEDLSEFDESERIRVLDVGVESVSFELKVGLYQIRYINEFGDDKVLNMTIKKVNGVKTIHVYHPE